MTDAPSTCVTVESVEHMERSDARHDLTITLTSAAGQRYTLVLPPSICYHLLVGLVGMQPPQGGGPVPHLAAIQPQHVSTFGTADGIVGLTFEIGGGWALPIAIDAENIDGVRGQLLQLERMASRGHGATRQ